MAKRIKSGETVVAGGLKWDQVLSTCTFEEENWSPCVAWVVGRQTEDSNHIEALNVIVQTGIRKLFSVITKEQLYLDVREFGNSKNKKVKEVLPNSEVCEACKMHIDANEPIPTPLLAKLIKWKMMAVKDTDIKRRGNDSKILKTKSSADKKRGKDTSKDRVKSPKKGGKKSPEVQQAKEGSKMKKRGEDDDENKFIDDEPEDGAQHYILVTGFHDPYLFQSLETINIKVNCVIGVSSQDYSGLKIAPIVDEKSENDKKEELKGFWRDLLPLLQQQPDTSTLHDIARLDYEVSSLIVPTDSLDAEVKVNYCTVLFEDIAVMLYNLLDAKRLYLTYLNNMKLTHVPVHEQKDITINTHIMQSLSSTKAVTSDRVPQSHVDMRYYNDLMNTIPQESVSVPLIMHCMLEQVVATEQGTEHPSEQVDSVRKDGVNFELSAYFAEMTAKLGLTAEEHEMLSQVMDFPQPSKEKAIPPKLININDNICNRTHHLKPHYGFCAEEVERNMLQLLPFTKLCQIQQPHPTQLKQRAIRLQELLHYCASADLSTSEIDHILKQFVFECMDLTKCDRNGFPLQRIKEGLHEPPIPYDDPYTFLKIMIPVSQKSTVEDLTRSRTPNEEYKGACSPVAERATSKKEVDSFSIKSSEMKKGILSSARSSISPNSPRHSITTSVRFDVPKSHEELEDVCDDFDDQAKSSQDSLFETTNGQQRNLDKWCFAEHFKPDILLQILQEASYCLPFSEIYHHKRDQSLMIVLHNPFNKERQNNVDWHKELHSNTGFRNYLENIAESVQTWLKKKDAEYQAQLLSKEVANIHKEEDDKFKAVEKTDKKGKRSPPRSATSKLKSPRGSGINSPEKPSTATNNPYIRQGSLKAWQEEQTKIAIEEEEKDKIKLERHIKSAQKLREKLEKEKEKTGKPEKGGTKSPLKDGETTPTQSAHTQINDTKAENEHVKPEPYWAFHGYDTGNKLIHMLGSTSTLFPSDGGIIKSERTEILQGNTAITSVVHKDGHSFVVHIVNPRDDLHLPEDYVAELEAKMNVTAEKQEVLDAEILLSQTNSASEGKMEEGSEHAKMKAKNTKYAVSQFGSLTAQLSDGMMLALSQFGPTGESYLQPYRPTINTITVAEAPSRATGINSPSRSKTNITKIKGLASTEMEKEKQESSQDENEVIKEKPVEFPKQDFQELFITCPDGLHVKYFLQSSVGVVPNSEDDRHMVVSQSYPFKTKGVQSCESVRDKYIQTEISRVITADGDVIKNMVDGSVEVLSADGAVSIFTGTWLDSTSPRDYGSQSAKLIPEIPKKGKNMKNLRSKSTQPEELLEELPKILAHNSNWIITYPGGERIQVFKESGGSVELDPLPVFFASDPETQQTMATRDDHVIIVHYPEGATVVEHSDGTRISTYYRNIASMEENKSEEDEGAQDRDSARTVKFVKVECPAYATVEFNTATSENLTVFGNDTSINVFPDGYYMIHHNKGGRIEIDTEGTMTYFPRRNRFLEHLNPEHELQYVFNHNADVITETVDMHGNVFNVYSNGEAVVTSSLVEDMFISRINQLVKEDNNDASFYDFHSPRFFIIHADGSGTELLRYEDVAEYLLMADQNPAAAVLKEALPGHPGVTGITILKPYMSGISEKWLKKYDQETIVPKGLRCRDLKTLPSYECKKPGPKFGTNVGKGLNIGTAIKAPVRIPILRCPEKLEFRQLLQYKPVTEEIRKKLQAGLSEYANAVVARIHAGNLMAIEDPRSEDEKNVAHDLKNLIELQKPETREFQPDQVKVIYEQAVAPTLPTLPSKPAPKRTDTDWKQLKKEKEEEAEAKNIIKNKIFEPYFNSELGKAFHQIKDKDTVENMPRSPKGPWKGLGSVKEGSNLSSSHAKNYSVTQDLPFIRAKVFESSSTPESNRIQYEPFRHSAVTGGMDRSKTTPKKMHRLKPPINSDLDSDISNPSDEKDSAIHDAIQTNHYGHQRFGKNSIVPAVIKGGKPGAHPNVKFSTIEDPVRRKVRTASIAGATMHGISELTRMRGIICNPQSVDFGTLREGYMYSYTVILTNTGIDACRFKIKQPSPTTGLRVKYISGSVAAGMSVDLHLELYAIASGPDGTSETSKFSYVVDIVTETDFLQLPIVANILTNEDYDSVTAAPGIERKTSAHPIARRPHLSVWKFTRK